MTEREVKRNAELEAQGWGFTRADQDGFTGEKVSALEHLAEEMVEAAKQLLDARTISHERRGTP